MKTRLRRDLGGRLLGGVWFQWLLTLVVVAAAAGVSLAGGSGAVRAEVAALQLPYLVVWACGLTAWAEVDDEGVRWRYFRPVRLRWAEVAEVELTGRTAPGTIWVRQSLLRVRPKGGGRPVIVGPALGLRAGLRLEFARAVAAAADRQGVPVSGPVSRYWAGLERPARPGNVDPRQSNPRPPST